MRVSTLLSMLTAATLALSACTATAAPLAPTSLGQLPASCPPGQTLIQKGTPQPVCTAYNVISLGAGDCGWQAPALVNGSAKGRGGKLVVQITGNVSCAPPNTTYWMVREVKRGYQVISDQFPAGTNFRAISDELDTPIHLRIISADVTATAKLKALRRSGAMATEPTGTTLIYTDTLSPKG